MPDAWLAGVLAAAVVVGLQFAVSRGGPGVSARSALHPRRHVQHAASGLAIAGIRHWALAREAAVATLALSAAGFFAVHRLRLSRPALNRWFLKQVGPVMRPGEERRCPSAFYFLLGCMLAFALFDERVAMAAVLQLSLADPAATAVGATLGDGSRWLPRGKSLAGAAAAALVSAAVGRWLGLGWLRAGLCGALGEALPVWVLDDNVSLPVVAGVCLSWVPRGGVVGGL